MSRTRLTDARVHALRPKKASRNVRDTVLVGFGVRVLPSGRKRFFIHSQHEGRRMWKIVGDPAEVAVADAREMARGMLASIRAGRPVSEEETLFEAVAETAFRRHGRNWKPSTLSRNRHYLRKQILPWFRGRQIAGITPNEVRDWFTSLHATPVAADRSMPVLSVIMKVAEAEGLRPEGSNPCKGIRRFRRQNRDRFLSDAEFGRLGRALRNAEPSLTVSIIRLLALTGCRSSEIRTLRWKDYRDGHVFLRDGKSGPRTVWLSSAAREVLDGLPRMSPWVFPAVRAEGPVPRMTLICAWSRIRMEADLKDVRLHDLRHAYASAAVISGEAVLTVGRLLGHNDPGTTLKYTHHAEADVERAAFAMGAVLGARQIS